MGSAEVIEKPRLQKMGQNARIRPGRLCILQATIRVSKPHLVGHDLQRSTQADLSTHENMNASMAASSIKCCVA